MAQFTNPERVLAYLAAQSRQAMYWLQREAPQDLLDQFEAAIAPPLTPEQQREVIERAKTGLIEQGLADNHAAITALEAEAEKLPQREPTPDDQVVIEREP